MSVAIRAPSACFWAPCGFAASPQPHPPARGGAIRAPVAPRPEGGGGRPPRSLRYAAASESVGAGYALNPPGTPPAAGRADSRRPARGVQSRGPATRVRPLSGSLPARSTPRAGRPARNGRGRCTGWSPPPPPPAAAAEPPNDRTPLRGYRSALAPPGRRLGRGHKAPSPLHPLPLSLLRYGLDGRPAGCVEFRIMTLRSPSCARVAALAVLAVATASGCTSRWAVRGNVDLTGDATAASIAPQKDPLLADPRPEPPLDPATAQGGES